MTIYVFCLHMYSCIYLHAVGMCESGFEPKDNSSWQSYDRHLGRDAILLWCVASDFQVAEIGTCSLTLFTNQSCMQAQGARACSTSSIHYPQPHPPMLKNGRLVELHKNQPFTNPNDIKRTPAFQPPPEILPQQGNSREKSSSSSTDLAVAVCLGSAGPATLTPVAACQL